MALTRLSFTAGVKWTLDDVVAGFADAIQADPGKFFSLASLDLTKFNQLRADSYNIPADGSFDFDLWSFTDLLGKPGGFTVNGVIAVYILPAVGDVGFGPSPSFGLQWFFQGPTQGMNLKAGGVHVFSNPPAGPGQVVTATSRNLRLTNSGAAAATGIFIAVGG